MATQMQPLHTEEDYEAAMAALAVLWNEPKGSAEGDQLEGLLVLVETYESEHHAIEPPDPIDAIEIRMDDLGIDQATLGAMIDADDGCVFEILDRRRGLTLDMVYKLANGLGLSERCLLQGLK